MPNHTKTSVGETLSVAAVVDEAGETEDVAAEAGAVGKDS